MKTQRFEIAQRAVFLQQYFQRALKEPLVQDVTQPGPPQLLNCLEFHQLAATTPQSYHA